MYSKPIRNKIVLILSGLFIVACNSQKPLKTDNVNLHIQYQQPGEEEVNISELKEVINYDRVNEFVSSMQKNKLDSLYQYINGPLKQLLDKDVFIKTFTMYLNTFGQMESYKLNNYTIQPYGGTDKYITLNYSLKYLKCSFFFSLSMLTDTTKQPYYTSYDFQVIDCNKSAYFHNIAKPILEAMANKDYSEIYQMYHSEIKKSSTLEEVKEILEPFCLEKSYEFNISGCRYLVNNKLQEVCIMDIILTKTAKRLKIQLLEDNNILKVKSISLVY